jgi:hypothetical protein
LLLADANEKLGHLVSAYELYRQATSLERNELWIGTVQQQAQKEARKKLEALQPRIPRLTVNIEGADVKAVSIKIDDVVVPNTLIGVARYADPGERQIVGQVGPQIVRTKVTLAERANEQVLLKFDPNAPTQVGSNGAVGAPNQPVTDQTRASSSSTSARDAGGSASNPQKTWGWVALGVGAAGMALGTTTGIMVATKRSELKDGCPDGQCGPAYWSKADTYDTLRTLSVVGFIVGGVGAAAGVTLLLTSPKQESKPSVGVWLTPATAVVRGEF